MENFVTTQTHCGDIRGIHCDGYRKYLGVRYATAQRFTYATPVTKWDGIYDATHYGNVCPQNRTFYEHLEIPERLFYHNEFRQDQVFHYDEDCLNLNIFSPDGTGPFPVLVFIHGGGFDSGANYDSAIDGAAYAKRGIVFVSIHYRVSIFGYFTHPDIQRAYGHDGNFGLDDQFTALRWIKENIADYQGDANNITVMGQSAGAISIQYLSLSPKCDGLYQRAIMLSGGGMFPKFALPRASANTHAYWADFMQTAGVTDLESLKKLDTHAIFTAIEELKSRRKDNTYNTMPVVDGYLISAPVDTLITHPLPIDYMLGYTNNDMYAIIMGYITHKYARENHAYLYYFDIDAPGSDHNGAFHSCDLRYVFGTLQKSHRPYDQEDTLVSDMMIRYISSFVKNGDPNQPSLPQWNKAGHQALHIQKPARCITMGSANWLKLLYNTLTKSDPK